MKVSNVHHFYSFVFLPSVPVCVVHSSRHHDGDHVLVLARHLDFEACRCYTQQLRRHDLGRCMDQRAFGPGERPDQGQSARGIPETGQGARPITRRPVSDIGRADRRPRRPGRAICYMTTALSVLEYSPGRSKVPYDVKSNVFVDVWACRPSNEGVANAGGDAADGDASSGDEKKDYAALLSHPDCQFAKCFWFSSCFARPCRAVSPTGPLFVSSSTGSDYCVALPITVRHR